MCLCIYLRIKLRYSITLFTFYISDGPTVLLELDRGNRMRDLSIIGAGNIKNVAAETLSDDKNISNSDDFPSKSRKRRRTDSNSPNGKGIHIYIYIIHYIIYTYNIIYMYYII
jgi:hypothetical protein